MDIHSKTIKDPMFIAGLHSLSIPRKMFNPLSGNNHHSKIDKRLQNHDSNRSISDIFDFIEIKQHDSHVLLSPEICLSIFRWMSRQRNSIVMSKRFFLKILHQIHQNMSHEPIVSMIQEDCPFLWFPRPNKDDINGLGTSVIGDMYRLSQVVMTDPSGYLKYLQSYLNTLSARKMSQVCINETIDRVIRAIDYDYPDNKELQQYMRLTHCKVCQMIEGSHGVRGQPRSYDLEHRYGQNCDCKDSSITSQFQNEYGLIRRDPSLQDMLSVIQNRIEFFQRLQSKGIALDYHLLSANKAAMAHCLHSIKCIYELIGCEIWKCFHIDDGLKPYCPQALRESIAVFHKESMLPLLEIANDDETVTATGSLMPKNATFVSLNDVRESLEANLLLAVDDMTLFNHFRKIFKGNGSDDIINDEKSDDAMGKAQNGSSLWIFLDAIPSDDHLGSKSFFQPHAVSFESYDIDQYEEKVRLCLRKSKEDFEAIVNSISKEFFYAEKSSKPLLTLLKVQSLSDFIETRYEADKAKTSSNEMALFTDLMNYFLYAAQAKLMSMASVCKIASSDVSSEAMPCLHTIRKEMRIEICQDIRKIQTLRCEKLQTIQVIVILDSV